MSDPRFERFLKNTLSPPQLDVLSSIGVNIKNRKLLPKDGAAWQKWFDLVGGKDSVKSATLLQLQLAVDLFDEDTSQLGSFSSAGVKRTSCHQFVGQQGVPPQKRAHNDESEDEDEDDEGARRKPVLVSGNDLPSCLDLTSFGVGLAKSFVGTLCEKDKEFMLWGCCRFKGFHPVYFSVCIPCAELFRVEFGEGRSTFANISKHCKSQKHTDNVSSLKCRKSETAGNSVVVKCVCMSFQRVFAQRKNVAVPPRTAYRIPVCIKIAPTLEKISPALEWRLDPTTDVSLEYSGGAARFFGSIAGVDHVQECGVNILNFFGNITDAD